MAPRTALLCLVALLAGCASGNPIRESWLPDDPAYWNQARKEGALLLTPGDKTKRKFIAPEQVNGLLTAKERIEAVSGVKSELALVDTESPAAFAVIHHGRPVIAVSLSLLEAFSNDWDALATTIGHELAHLHLGHRGEAREEREGTVRAGQALGTVLNLIVPFSGTIASLGVTAYARSFTRDEERQADHYGLKWASEAGYDPCGHARVMTALSTFTNVPMLSSHPGYGERSDLASQYAGKLCQ